MRAKSLPRYRERSRPEMVAAIDNSETNRNQVDCLHLIPTSATSRVPAPIAVPAAAQSASPKSTGTTPFERPGLGARRCDSLGVVDCNPPCTIAKRANCVSLEFMCLMRRH